MAVKKRGQSSRASQASKKDTIVFPKDVLDPIQEYLKAELKMLKKMQKNIRMEDPFRTSDRTLVSAAPDDDAEEQFGHERAQAMQDELSKRILQTKKALLRVRNATYGTCEGCGMLIDTDRLMIKPEAMYCVKCEKKLETQ